MEHFFEQFQRQADDVGFAAVEQMDPVEAILIAEGARLSFPRARVEIRFELAVGDGVHDQPTDGDADMVFVRGAKPQTQAAVDVVFAVAEQPQHLARVFPIPWFAEDVSHAFGDRVAADHQPLGDALSHIARLLPGQPGDEFRWRFPAADAAFGRLVRQHDRKAVAGAFQQFATPGRLAGKNQRFDRQTRRLAAFFHTTPNLLGGRYNAPMPEELQVLYEDNHLLVVNKPADLATMGVSDSEPSLWRRACAYLKAKYAKPGNVYLGVVSRVDAAVTGAVVFARTSKAAARLSEQFREASVGKVYWALVERPPDPPRGACTDWLVKDEPRRRMILVASSVPGAQEARLTYRTLEQLDAATLVEVRLETGRKHQIRVQLAARGWHVLGDEKYGARSRFPRGIALHARRLVIDHPVRHEPLDIVAPLPAYWPRPGNAFLL